VKAHSILLVPRKIKRAFTFQHFLDEKEKIEIKNKPYDFY